MAHSAPRSPERRMRTISSNKSTGLPLVFTGVSSLSAYVAHSALSIPCVLRSTSGRDILWRMRREKTSVSQEDYLKAIWEIVQEEQVPISARLAEDLGVTPPAVTAALKRMTRAGYLRVRRGGRIELSPKGKGAAQHLVLRHRLAEKLLTEIIGLEWSRAHEEAERLEHGISPEVSRLLLARFGRDSRCPHGVPLFGGMSRLRRKHGAVKLSETEVGHTYEILRVYEIGR